MMRVGRERSRRFVAGLLFFVVITLRLTYARQWVLNFSDSLPPGLYTRVDEAPARGALVEFSVPRTAQTYLSQCGKRTVSGRTFLKPIAAIGGECVDTTGDWLCINQVRLAPIQTHDSQGRPLPVWRANRPLRADEYFVFSARVPNSLDSRYFGPIQRNDILAVRAPLVTW